MSPTPPQHSPYVAGLEAYIRATRAEIAAVEVDISILGARRQALTAHLQTLESIAHAAAPPAPGNQPASPRKPWRRAPTGSWARAVRDAAASNGGQFTYRQLQAAAQALNISAPMGSVRVRVSKFKARGFITQVSPGTYALVP